MADQKMPPDCCCGVRKGYNILIMKYILERKGLPLERIEGQTLADALLNSGFFQIRALDYRFSNTLWEFSDVNPVTGSLRIELPIDVSEVGEFVSWVLRDEAFTLYRELESEDV